MKQNNCGLLKLSKITILCIFLVLGLTIVTTAQSTSWTGRYSTSWTTFTNWTAGVPTATTNAIIGDASFTGAYQPTITTTAVCNSLTVGGTKSSTLTLSYNLSASGNVTISSNGTISQNSNTFKVVGNWYNSGTYTALSSGSKVTMAGTTSTINGPVVTNFRKLTIASGGVTTLNTNINIAGSTSKLTVSGTLNPNNSPTYTVTGSTTGSITVGSAGVLKVNASSFAGNYTTPATPVLNAGSIVEYSATTTNQTISNTLTYSTLKISGAMVKTLAGNLPAFNATSASAGNVYVTAGTLDLLSYTANRGTTIAGGTFSVSNGAFLKLGGASNFPVNFNTTTLSLTSTVEYNGNSQTVAAQTYGNLTLSGASGAVIKTMPSTAFTIAGNFTSNVNTATSVSYTAASNIAITGSTTIGTSTTFNGGTFSHTLVGNLVNNGTLTGGTSTISLNGSGSVMSGTGTYSFYNLAVTSSNNSAASGTNITVGGNFSTSAAGSFTQQSAGTFTMSGATKTISGTGIVFNSLTCSGSISTTSNLAITGNLVVSGSLNSTGGIINMSGAAKTISGSGTILLNALTVSGTITASSSFTIGNSLDVSGSLTATAGTATFTGTSTLDGTANLYNVVLNGTSLQLSTNALLGIANTFTKTAGTLDVTSSTPNTVSYNGTVAQSVLTGTYHHLTLSNGSTKTAAGALTINGDISIASTTTFVAGSFTHNLSGNWNNAGIFTAGTSTINLTGSQDAAISGATTFNILTVNKSSANNKVTLLSSISTPTVNMTSGTISTGANTITITGTRTGTGIILGIIKRSHTFTTGVAYEFEGPNNTITFTAVSGVTSVTVTVTKGSITDFPFGGSMNRLYDIAVPGGTYTANLRLHYEDDELNGNSEAAVQLWKYSGSAWASASKSASNATSNYVEQTGLTAITTRWTLSDDANVVRWNGSVNNDWANAANWTTVQGSPSFPPSANDIVNIGLNTFTNQPVISTAATVKNLLLGSVQVVSLSLITGGSLNVNGNISGSWSGNATHNINVNNQALTVNGSLTLSDGTTSHAINLNAGSGTINIPGSLTQSGGANIIFSGSATMNIGTDFNYTNGTFTAGTGTVVYNGSASQNVAGVAYNHLTINKTSGSASAGSTTTVAGDLTVTGGQLTLNAALNVAGNATISSAGTISNNGITVTVGGNWVRNGSYVSSNGNMIFNGTGSQSIAATTFNNVTINKASGIASLTGNLAMNGNMTITAGTLDLGANACNRTSVGGTFTVASGAVLTLSGANNFPLNYSVYAFSSTSTTQYNGTVAQTIAGIAYGDLTLTNGGSNLKTLAASTVINGNLSVNSSAGLSAGTYTIDLYGNWTNNGTFTAGTSTVLFEGSNKTITGNTTFWKSAIYGSYRVTGSDITYNSTLRVVTGGSYDGGSGIATLNGDLTNNGSLISNGVTNFSGTVVQTIRFANALVSNSSGVINFNGTVSPVLNSTSTPTFATLNVNNTGGINPSVDWMVFVAFNVNTGAVFNGGNSTHSIYGTFTNNGTVTSTGTLNFVPSSAKTYGLGANFNSSGTVIFDGTGAIATTGAPVFTNVIVSNTAGVTPGSNWNMAGDFSISQQGIFNASANTYTVAGDIESQGTLNGGTSSFTMSSADGQLTGSDATTFYDFTVTGLTTANTDFNVSHNFTNNGTIDASSGQLVMTGSGASVINGSATFSLAQVEIQKTQNATTTLSKNITGVNNLTVTSGKFDVSSYTVTQDATTGAVNTLTVSDSAVLKIGGTNSLPLFSTYAIDTLSTVEYAGTNQTVASVAPYGNLTISTTGTKTATGALNILNDFNLTNGTFVGGNFVDTLDGNWVMTSGTFTNTGTTVYFNGANAQSISSTGAFNNVIINKTTGTTKILSDITVNSALTFTKGTIQTDGYKVIIPSGGSVSGAAQASGWVNGNLQKNIAAGSNVARTYELGDSLNYTPVSIALGTVSTAGNVVAGVKATDHPNISSSAISSTKSINRYWTISNSGTAFTNAAVTFNWAATDADPGLVNANLKVGLYTGSWTITSFANITATSIQATGLAAFGDFAVGEACIAGTWIGGASSVWNSSSNWQCGLLPDNTTNVVITAGAANYPVIDAITTEINNLTLPTGATLSVNNGTLKIKGSIVTTGGNINADNGRVELTGTASQTIPAGLFASTIVKELVISNTAGVLLGGSVKVTGLVGFGNVNSTVLITGSFLTLASSATVTARVADITNGGTNTGNAISGTVTVERYLSAKRAYRFITAPIAGGSIRSNWMENTNNPTTSVNNNPAPGYGIQITGSGGDANGFDATSTNNPSLFTFNNQSQAWTAVTSTSGSLLAGNAFRVFARGDRSTNLAINEAIATPTTLRATGTLLSGSVIFQKTGVAGTAGTPSLAPVTNAYNLIGNPYASPINWLTVNRTNVSGNIAVFDATISGSKGRGAYVSYNAIQGTNSNPSSGIDNYIQSGEAFFVLSTGTNPSLTFKETDKISTMRSVFRSSSQIPKLSLQLLLPEQLNTTQSADGLMAFFDDSFSDEIGEEDSYKFPNQDENIAILRNGVLLSIEGRKPVSNADTLPLKIWQLQQKTYSLRIKMSDFTGNTQAFLEDRYLNTSTAVNNNTEVIVPFAVTADTASATANRFKIVFKTGATLPVSLTNVKAYEKNKGVEIDWTTQAESNMNRYVVERSLNAQEFIPVDSVKAKNISGAASGYNAFDNKPRPGVNYYRIKSLDNAGATKYSEIVKVVIDNEKSRISICSNPVYGHSVKLLFDNAPTGNYFVSLVNAAGEKVYTGNLSYSGGTVYKQFGITPSLPGGVYQLSVVNNSYVKNIAVLIQ